ncbi:hypothetical protein SDC9_150331 [bioreactor metagenome]|uniref:Uncharacterized protein n=1 Tax=bioreactor metagenome TaxID=1076179 RepID=A0A645EM62_9ZZZZ
MDAAFKGDGRIWTSCSAPLQVDQLVVALVDGDAQDFGIAQQAAGHLAGEFLVLDEAGDAQGALHGVEQLFEPDPRLFLGRAARRLHGIGEGCETDQREGEEGDQDRSEQDAVTG